MIKYIQLPTCKLAEFASSASTSFTVSGFLYNDGVTPVATTDIGDICYATLEPKTAREELISFTIDSVTAAGVATITATRGLLQASPYTTGGATFDHQNGSDLVISNNPGLFNQLTAKDNPEVITEQWTFPEPTANNSPATKAYADGLVITGGAEATNTTRGNVLLSESPALTIGTCTISIATPAVISFVAHGLVEGDSIKLTTTGALPTGLTAGNTYFVMATGLTANTFQVSATLGGVAINTSGTQSGSHTLTRWTPIAIAETPSLAAAIGGGGDFGTPSSTNKFVTEDFITNRPPQVVTFTSSGTWTKDAGLKYIIVEGVGGGGSGGYGYNSDTQDQRAGSGGGAGGYFRKVIVAASLGSTETVTVGAGGTVPAQNVNGNTGGTTSFGSHASAVGGAGGSYQSDSAGGAGGMATGGNVNITGGIGHYSMSDGNQSAASTSTPGEGGASYFGGSNGAYGSGSRGGLDSAPEAGTQGVVIVTEYYS
jgi:hypothetical protein